MFGFVVANTEKLSPEQLLRYRALYCGLCRKIGERHGECARIALTYDLVFLAIVLSSVYDGEILKQEKDTCVAHPTQKKDYIYDSFTDYASDMNIALAYYNYLDDWQDDKSIKARLQAHLLGKGMHTAKQLYPRQIHCVEQCLHDLHEAERRDESDPEIPANIFGTLLGELFRYEETELGDRLFDFGCALGRFIYLMDAFVDLKKDIKKQKYNPLVRYTGEQILPMLDIQMAQCAELFSLLPVRKDKDLCENILYSGVWSKAELIKIKEANKRHG